MHLCETGPPDADHLSKHLSVPSADCRRPRALGVPRAACRVRVLGGPRVPSGRAHTSLALKLRWRLSELADTRSWRLFVVARCRKRGLLAVFVRKDSVVVFISALRAYRRCSCRRSSVGIVSLCPIYQLSAVCRHFSSSHSDPTTSGHGVPTYLSEPRVRCSAIVVISGR